jgi:hypothetical protein
VFIFISLEESPICEEYSFWKVFPNWDAFTSWEAFPEDKNMEKLCANYDSSFAATLGLMDRLSSNYNKRGD